MRIKSLKRIEKIISTLAGTLALFILSLPSASGAVEWTIERVDAPKYFSGFSSRAIALDRNNRPHIAYGGDHLYYAHFDGIGWQYETVDNSPGVGKHASIAIDSLNNVHISYFDYTNWDLKYATNATGVWVTETIDGVGTVGMFSFIAIDSAGNVHISYIGDGGLKYATNATGVWVTETIDGVGTVGMFSFIAIDSAGNVHISYIGDGGLKYATNATGVWVTETIDGVEGWFSSIALDSADNVHISYCDWVNANLKYATNATGVWVTETIDGVEGWFSSIALDSADNVHISYCDWVNANLKYATNATGVWVTETIDGVGAVGMFSSIAIDSLNNVHISYFDWTNKDLKYATNATGVWVTETIDGAEDVGRYTSIAIDSLGNVHISYFGGGNLKYATNATGVWVTETIDGAEDVGRYTSIAIDSLGNVHISYCDWVNANLKYATNATGVWVTETIDSAGNVGMFSSIAIDSADNVHISYFGGGNLKYATNAWGVWVTETIDSVGQDGGHTSIAIDSASNVHISYFDWTNKDLKYATNATGVWVTETIDSAEDVGRYTSIAIDSLGNAHISYFGGGNLKYATNAWGVWVTETIGGAEDVGRYTSIAIDSLGNVHISYCDWVNANLKYATNATGVWVTETIDSAGFVGEYSSIAIDSLGNAHISYYDRTNRDLKYAAAMVGSPPDPCFTADETSSSMDTLHETIISQNATLNTSVTGSLSGSLNFTDLKFVFVNSGSFTGKGFSRGNWTANIEGFSFTGNWQGMVYKRPEEGRIYLKGTVSGGLRGIVKGYLRESITGSGVFDLYQATWTISHLGAAIVYATLELEGTVNYEMGVEFPSTQLYALQTFIEGEVSGHWAGPLSIVLTHVRVNNEANPYYGQGFSTISYVSQFGSGEGWTYDKITSPGVVELNGLFTAPLLGIVSGTLDESGLSRTLSISLKRIDLGLPPRADLKVEVWGQERISPGETVNYIIEYRNDGLKGAKNKEIAFRLPDNMRYISSTGGGVYNFATRKVVWQRDIPPRSRGLLSVTSELAWGLPAGTLLGFAYIRDPVEIPVDPTAKLTISEIHEMTENSLDITLNVSTATLNENVRFTMTITETDKEIEPIFEVKEINGEIEYIFTYTMSSNPIWKVVIVYKVCKWAAPHVKTAFKALRATTVPKYVKKYAPYVYAGRKIVVGTIERDRFLRRLREKNLICPDGYERLKARNDGMIVQGVTLEVVSKKVKLPGWASAALSTAAKKTVKECIELGWESRVGQKIWNYSQNQGEPLPDDLRRAYEQGGPIGLAQRVAVKCHNAQPVESQIIPAHDPNIKYGPDGDFVLPGQKLNYRVEFENEGEGIAFGVYFTDTLDEDLDVTTLEIGPVIAVSQNPAIDGTVIAPPGTFNPDTRTITWFVGRVEGRLVPEPGPGEGGFADFSVNVRSDAKETEIINFGIIRFPSVPQTIKTNAIVSIVDIIPPRFSDVNQSKSSVTLGETVEVSAFWQDGIQLGRARLAIKEDGTWQDVDASCLRHSGREAWSRFTIQTTQEGRTHWRIHGYDTAGNMTTTDKMSFTVTAPLDITAPVISAQPDQILVRNAVGNVTWVITEENPSHYWVMRDGMELVAPTAYTSGADINVPIDTTTLGIWNYTIFADDTAGNVASDEVNVTIITFVDTDRDGMPDAWELQYGLDPTNPNDAHLDNDGDGYSNLQEYNRGINSTDPTNPRCYPTLPFIDILRSKPYDGQGIAENSLRVPLDTSIALRIKDNNGIDKGSIIMTVNGVDVSGRIRVREVTPEGGATDLWIIYDPDPGTFSFGQRVNVTVEAADIAGYAMSPYVYSFEIETEEEHNNAQANRPLSIVDTPHPEQHVISVLDGEIRGAKIIYNPLEDVTPRFGPLGEIPGLNIANVRAIGIPIRLEPPTVFDNPVTIHIPVLGVINLDRLEIYYFSPALGWKPASEVEGWMVPGSRVNHPDTSPPTIEIKINHFSGVQAGIPLTPCGDGKVLPCFIATAAFGTPMAEEVVVLSRFRDQYLLTNELGRRFVSLYYQHSPALAEYISDRQWAKRLVRGALWPLVRITEFIVGGEEDCR